MAPPPQVGCNLKFAFIPVPSRLIMLFLATALSSHATTFYLTVAGLGGEPEYEQRFTGWAKDIDKLLKTAEPNAKVETLSGTGAVKTAIEAKLRDFARDAK